MGRGSDWRDFAFIVEALLPIMDEPRLAMIARNRGNRSKEGESVDDCWRGFSVRPMRASLAVYWSRS